MFFGLAITAAQIISWAIEHRALIETVASAAIKYGPSVVAVAREGATAIEAANQAAPELVPHFRQLASGLMQYLPAGHPASVDDVAESIAQASFGPVGWTTDETQQWYDRAVGAA